MISDVVVFTPRAIHPQNFHRMEIIQIECGSYHSAFVDINGLLYMCGKGQYGQLGIGAY